MKYTIEDLRTRAEFELVGTNDNSGAGTSSIGIAPTQDR